MQRKELRSKEPTPTKNKQCKAKQEEQQRKGIYKCKGSREKNSQTEATQGKTSDKEKEKGNAKMQRKTPPRERANRRAWHITPKSSQGGKKENLQHPSK